MTKVYQRIRSVSLILAAIILVATASAKVISVWRLGGPTTGSLGQPNLVVPWLSEGWMLLVAALAECLLAAVILRSRSAALRFGTLAWFSVACLLYRSVLHAADGTAACNCAGVWNGNHQATGDLVAGLLLGVLGAIGWLGLLATVIASRRARATTDAAGHSETGKRLIQRTSICRSLMCIGVCGMLIATPFIGAGQSPVYYQVELQISQTNYFMRRGDANAGQAASVIDQRIYSYATRCVFGAEKWLIETHFSRSAVHTYYFNGATVYHLIKLVPNNSPEYLKIQKQLDSLLPVHTKAREADAPEWESLTITRGSHPLSDFGASLPWLAFCSGPYLRSPDRLVPLPGAEIRHVAASFGFRDHTTTFPDPLGLPRELELAASANLLRKSPLHESLLRGGRTPSELKIALQPQVSYPDGFLTARYRVISHTNLNDWNVPTGFSYEQFIPRPNGEHFRTLTVLGQVTRIAPVEAPDFSLSTTQRYSVVDYRFRHKRKLVDAIHYAITNGLLLDEHTPRLQKLYETAVSRAPIDPVVRARLRIYGLFLALAGVPVIAMVWCYITKLAKQTKKGRLRQRPGFMTVCWLLLFTPLAGRGQSPVYYQVELQISQTNYFMRRGDANAGQAASVIDQRIYSYATRCVFGFGKWLIVTHFARNAVETFFHDGTNVYTTCEQTADDPKWADAYQKHYGTRPPTAEELKASGWISLRISPGKHPLGDFGGTFPWLAFRSADYLKEPGRLIPLGADMRHSLESFGFEDRTLLFPDRLGLPQRVEFFISAKLLKKSARNSALLRSVRDPGAISVALNPVPITPEGFLAARYEVLDATNIGGINIPIVFRFDFFDPGSNKQPLLRGEAWGRVTSLRAVAQPQPLVTPGKRFGVIDYRFRHPFKLVDDIQYTITNGIVPPTFDPALRAIYRAEVSAARLDPVVKARFGIYGLAAVLVVPPVILAALAWRKRTTQKSVSNQLKL